jgi:small subunit ribosomal protein S9
VDQVVDATPRTAEKRVNRAMQVYMEAASSRRQFMQAEHAEYENGRRHLANMMGWNLDEMTPEQINKYSSPRVTSYVVQSYRIFVSFWLV